MDNEQIANLLYKFVKDTESQWCYDNYLNEVVGIYHDSNYTQEEKDNLLKDYVKQFMLENRPAPRHFYLRDKEKGELLSVETSSCGEENSDTEYTISTDGHGLWEAETPEHAAWVRYNPTKWYNANYNTPRHFYKPDQLEVIDEYGTVYPEPPMSELEYASLYYKIYGVDDYLKQQTREIKRNPNYDPSKSYNLCWYSVRELRMKAENTWNKH